MRSLNYWERIHENVCVVGDDAQSIYSFRGATIQNILQFQKDYDDVKVVKLEQNYRSTQNILILPTKSSKIIKDKFQKSYGQKMRTAKK